MIPYLYVPPLQIGPVPIHVFGFFAALAVVVGFKAAKARAHALALDVRVLDAMLLPLLLGVFVGAHLFSVVLYTPGQVISDPLVLIKLWDGISSFGGIVGGLIVVFICLRGLGLRRKHYIHALLFGAIVGLTIGRLGCSVIHDHPGKLTTSPIAVKGWPTADTPPRSFGFYTDGPRRYDLGLCEFLYMLPLTALLYALRNWRPFDYFHAALMLYLYAPMRFLLDSLRIDDKRYFALTPGQYFSIAMILLAVWLTIRGLTRPPARDETMPEVAPIQAEQNGPTAHTDS